MSTSCLTPASFLGTCWRGRFVLAAVLFGVICGLGTTARAAAPCCAVTSIDVKNAVVTAKESATGRTFTFKVADVKLLKSLRVGQGVYANFAKKQVSVDGVAPCCNILSIALPKIAGGNAAQSSAAGAALGHANPAAPCCAITTVDSASSLVTAKEDSTGKTFTFKVSDAALLNSLIVGQGIYANFGAKQVSVNGIAPCCAIVSLPGSVAELPQSSKGQAAPPSSTNSGRRSKSNQPNTQGNPANNNLAPPKTEVKASEGDTAQAIRAASVAHPPGNDVSGKPGSTLAGNSATSTSQTQLTPTVPVFVHERLQLRLLSQGKKWRLQSFSGNIGGRAVHDDALYHLAGREGIAESPVPQQIKNELLKDADSSGDRDAIYIVHKSTAERIAAKLTALSSAPSGGISSTGSSSNGCNDAFGWGNHLTETAQINFSNPGDLLELTLNDQDLGPVNASGKLDIKAPVSGQISGAVDMRVLETACEPVAFKLRNLRINGNMNMGALLDLDAKLGVTHGFKKRLVSQPLGGFGFFVGPIPVYIGFDAFVEGRLDVKVPNLVQVKYSAQGSGHGAVNVVCTTHGCSGSQGLSFQWSAAGGVNVLSQGVHAIVKPGVLGGLEAYLYDPSVINAHAGIEPYMKGDLWAYSGSGCNERGTVSDREYTKALTADLDGGFDVLAGIDASGLAPNGFFSSALDQEWTVYNWEKHLNFYDLLGGSNALTPLLQTDSPAYAARPKTVGVQMRPCYPYATDKDGKPVIMTYQLTWGDSSSNAMPQAPIGSAANASHTWIAPGQFNLQARPLEDSHGRRFPVETTQASMDVKSGSPATLGNRQP